MKLPTQAHPIMRTEVQSKFQKKLMRSITASECNTTDCAWAISACVVTAPLGAAAVLGCIIGMGALDCRDCIPEVIQEFARTPPERGPRGQPV